MIKKKQMLLFLLKIHINNKVTPEMFTVACGGWDSKMAPRFPSPSRHAQSVNVMGRMSCYMAKMRGFCRCPSSADFKLVTGEIALHGPFRRCLEVGEV